MIAKNNTSPEEVNSDRRGRTRSDKTAESIASPKIITSAEDASRPAEDASKAPLAKPYDPFAEENIRLPQDVLDEVIAYTELAIVPVQKPSDQQFIRVHPSPDYQHVAAIIGLEEERGAKYLIHPSCVMAVKEYGISFRFEQLFLYVTSQGNYFFWPIKLPTSTRENRWLDTAREAAEKAMHKWVCMHSDQKLGAYVATPALDNDAFPEPEWPQKNGVLMAKNELLAKAFRDRLIMNVEHPVIRKLRGAILK